MWPTIVDNGGDWTKTLYNPGESRFSGIANLWFNARATALQLNAALAQDSRVIEGLEMNIVSHDVRKFFGLLLKKNGYVLGQLFSPLVVLVSTELNL